MDAVAAKILGRELLDNQGLEGWTIQLNRSPNYLGQCWHDSKVIALSVHFVDHAEFNEVKAVILHEIAHALVGPGKDHGDEWREVAELLGIPQEPCGKFLTPAEIKERREKIEKDINQEIQDKINQFNEDKKVKPAFGEPEVKILYEAPDKKKKPHVPPLTSKCPYCGEVIKEKSRLALKDQTFILSENCTHIISKENVKEVSYDNWVSGSGKIPYPYQVEGFKFIEKANGRCLIADQPGLGKTLQALSFLRFHPEISTPCLWLGKTTLSIQTLKESIDWNGFDFPAQIIEHSRFFPLPGMKIYISSYDLLKRIKKEKLASLGIKTVIFDEVQHIKNPSSARTQAVRDIVNNADFFIALSGTPWKNRGSEYFSVLNMLAPEKFPSYKSFVDRWVRMDYDPQTGKYKEGGIRNIPEFREYTKDFILRRLRKDVLPDLPPINRQIRYVELQDIYGENYEKAEGEVAAVIKDIILEGGVFNQQLMQAEIMKLKHITGLAKVDAQVEDAISFIEDSEPWEKLTIFIHHIDVGDDLEGKLNDYLLQNGYSRCLRLQGGINPVERDRIVEQFKRDEKRRILIASTLASGEGLNLQFCQNASMMERQWNPGNEEQAEFRFSRPLTYSEYPRYLQDELFDEDKHPNKVSIRIPYMICANTVDEMLTHIVERKRVNFDGSMNEGQEDLKFSEADMVKELAQAIVNKRYGAKVVAHA